ncbi:MAG: hypothetical protein WCR12_02750 [Dysgonamonadaceae bacterium]
MITIKKIFSGIFKVIKWAIFIIVGLLIVSALYNLTLPKKSKTIEILSAKEKSFIAEEMNLQQKIGNEVWPNWGDTLIPVMVYNEKYAFLIGYPNPPVGWFKIPNYEALGTEWEMVNSDDFAGATYYRQPLPNPAITPENFTVKVGDRWVSTIETKEYAEIAFYKGFREELPPVLNAIFPYKIFWNLFMGSAEKYIGGMAHESFHSFQGAKVPDLLVEAERVAHLEKDYPWHEPKNADGWEKEIDLLMKAYYSENNATSLEFVDQFLESRKVRRQKSNLSVEFIQYEQKREWLEGLAKYAELTIGLKAWQDENYRNIKEIDSVREFKNYKTYTDFYKQQIDEVKRAAVRPSENRFYYSGMLQAVMLDRLLPEWKKEAFKKEVYLEYLLEMSVNIYSNYKLE